MARVTLKPTKRLLTGTSTLCVRVWSGGPTHRRREEPARDEEWGRRQRVLHGERGRWDDPRSPLHGGQGHGLQRRRQEDRTRQPPKPKLRQYPTIFIESYVVYLYK